MNELNNTLMSTAIGAEVTGYVLARSLMVWRTFAPT